MVAKGERVGRGMEWEAGVSRCKLLCMEGINNKVLLQSTENYIQYLMINCNGKQYQKQSIYIYMCMQVNHFAVQQNQHNRVNQLYFNKKKQFVNPKSYLVAQRVKNLPAMQEAWVRSLGGEAPLEKRIATHSSTLAWRIPWMEEPGELQSLGLHKSRT